MRAKNGRGPTALRCQGCAQTWLMPGARAGEAYICKACGHPLSVVAPRAGAEPKRKRESEGAKPEAERRTSGGR